MDAYQKTRASVMAERPLSLRIGDRLRPVIDRVVVRWTSVPDRPVLDAADFPWIDDLRARWPEIRAEAAAVLADRQAVPPLGEISPDHADIAVDSRWKSFFFAGYGHRVDANCARCPSTAEAIARVPNLNSAFFSILEPGAHIPPHVGVTKALTTCHLGLLVPAGRCEMRVADEMVRWHEGEALVFDDTYEHEVWNDTAEIRAVLLIQFERPMRYPGKLVSDGFLWMVRNSAFVKDAVKGFHAWEEAHRRTEAAVIP